MWGRDHEVFRFWGDGRPRSSGTPALANVGPVQRVPRAQVAISAPRAGPKPVLAVQQRDCLPCPEGPPVSYKPGDFWFGGITLYGSGLQQRCHGLEPRGREPVLAVRDCLQQRDHGLEPRGRGSNEAPPPRPQPPALPPLRDPAGPLTVGWRCMKDN